MPTRRTASLILALAAFAPGCLLAAGSPYDAASFAALQKAGQPILVHVHASWCPTCRAQDPIVSGLLKDPRFARLHAVEVDFDTQKDLLRAWHVGTQSTLIVFRGDKEIARSVGDTRAASIEALMLRPL